MIYIFIGSILVVLGTVAKLAWDYCHLKPVRNADVKRQLDAANETIRRYRAERRGYR